MKKSETKPRNKKNLKKKIKLINKNSDIISKIIKELKSK
jgi:hypothetical protein